MKALLLTLISLAAVPAFASQVVCTNNSNSDIELHLVMDGAIVSQVSLVNIDWGSAGAGDLQRVQALGDNTYVVSSQSGVGIGINAGGKIVLQTAGETIQRATLYGVPGSPNGDDFGSCY